MVKRRNLLLLFLAVATLSFPISCGTLGSRPKSASAGMDKLGFDLWVSDENPGTGDPLQLRFTVTNEGDQVYLHQVKDGTVMDIDIRYWVAGRDYVDVAWSDGREITPEMQRLELAPGESETIEWTWVAVGEARGKPSLVRGVLRWMNRRDELRKGTVEMTICIDGCANM